MAVLFTEQFLPVVTVFLILFSCPWTAQADSAQSPVQLPFKDGATAGPDGPWNFLSMPVGSDGQSMVDFYVTSGQPQSILVTSTNCTDSSSGCLNGGTGKGYYKSNLTDGATEVTPDGQQLAVVTSSAYDWDHFYAPLNNLSGSGRYTLRSLDIGGSGPGNGKYDDVAVYLTSDLRTYIGSKSYRPLSVLSMAGSNGDLNKSQLVGGGPAAATTLTNVNIKAGVAQAFGLHYGAAGFGQKGSLYMGGYDARRVIEKPIINDVSADGFNLANLTIETSSGDSPWLGSSRVQPSENLVTSTVKNMHVLPHTPYILLPAQTILLLTQSLPLYHDSETGLILWNTTDPLYYRLMTSPTFLKFSFSAAASGSIRVPFAALSLNLTSPIKDKPTPYFPFKPCDYWCVLGRAFLQSALYMEAWAPNAGTNFLAQAPGPSVGGASDKTAPAAVSCESAIPTVDLPSSPPKLEDTWASFLQPLGVKASSTPAPAPAPSSAAAADATESSSAASGSSNGGLSPGAKGGIAVAVLLAVGIVAGVLMLLFLRRRRQRQRARIQEKNPSPTSTPPAELATARNGALMSVVTLVEAPSMPPAAEAGGVPRAELQGPDGAAFVSEKYGIMAINGGEMPASPALPSTRTARSILTVSSPHSRTALATRDGSVSTASYREGSNMRYELADTPPTPPPK